MNVGGLSPHYIHVRLSSLQNACLRIKCDPRPCREVNVSMCSEDSVG
jgi:hypothetical protein